MGKNKNTSNILYDELKKQNISIKQLAFLLDVSPRVINRLVLNKDPMTISMANKISNILKIDTKILLTK